MPEIKHTRPTPAPPLSTPKLEPEVMEVLEPDVAERLSLSEAGTKTDPKTTEAPDPAIAYEAQLEELVQKILARKVVEKQEAGKLKEPDWTKVNEAQAINLSNPIYIPAIEHDIPDYLTVKLEDEEYECVWVNRDQRRTSYHLAMGYEFLRPEHCKRGWKVPLKFDSEKNYIFEDVIAMRVHKRILYGKRRRALEISQLQLRGAKNHMASKLRKDAEGGDELLGISPDPLVDLNFSKDRLSFYDPK